MPDERPFDPTILQMLEREMRTWPRHQAIIGMKIIRAVIAGGPEDVDRMLDQHTGAYKDLTPAQVLKVVDALRKIYGLWTH